MKEMLKAALMLLFRHGGNVALFGSEYLSHIAPNIQHKVAVIRLCFFRILN